MLGSVRAAVVVLVALAGVGALLAPAVPFLSRYGTLPKKADGPVNVLLAGVDVNYDDTAPVWPYPAKPENYNGRTDTLMLAQAWPDGRVNLLSIPRDSWVNIPGYGWGKINGANAHGGPGMLVRAVESLTGMRVDAHALLSLNALPALTDAAGGVTVDVQQPMKYDDNAGHLHIDLKPGRQRLNGEQAVGFLRFRKDNLGDIGRIARQQQFLGALAAQAKNPLHWWRLPAMVGAADRNMKTNLSRAQVAALLGAALGGVKLQTFSVPGDFGAGGTWAVDRAALRTTLAKHFRDPNDPRSLGVAVVNTDAPDGSARRLKARLEALGYSNVWIVNEARAPATTTATGEAAARVLQDVGHGAVSQAAGAPGADVTVRLGNDTPGE
ncbi:LCP family protein [Deinococcus multiflagellatus]|uniref:LCP family protein n=1 Tax=Deinococcus multiflagellatus TaxID=1656887 RepID=A0ABW1ZN58_9DEIO|nr:LCP family protein [Deinococcus multiflagellatus]MBZ9712681.1 LCP family protein [Deinococcus multiflagellatus]